MALSAQDARTLLRDRIAAIPGVLDEVLAAPLPSALPRIAAAPRFVVTGGGFSEGPARVLAALLSRCGRPARYLPLSSFATPSLPRSDAALVLFSQGLAPNARLPLAHVASFAETLVFSSVSSLSTGGESGKKELRTLRQRLEQRGVCFYQHPPLREDALLARVVGPAAALAGILRFLNLLQSPAPLPESLFSTLPAAYQAAQARRVELFDNARRPLAIVAGEDLCELAFPLRWKLLEGLRVPDPPVWDFLQIIHGPLQAVYDSPLTLLCFERAAPTSDRDFVTRLESLLDPARHRIVRFAIPSLHSELAKTPLGPLVQLLLLDGELNGALAATVMSDPQPLHLGDWPLRQRDGALYDIDPATLQLPGWMEL